MTSKGFYDYAGDDGSIPDGYYHLKVRGSEVNHWDDGRPHLDLQTEVMEGEYLGAFGPRHSWNIPEEYSYADPKGGTRTVTEEAAKRSFSNAVGNVFGVNAVQLSNHLVYDEKMLNEIAAQIDGMEFIALVGKNKKDYPSIKRFYSLAAPPKQWKGGAGGGFTVSISPDDL